MTTAQILNSIIVTAIVQTPSRTSAVLAAASTGEELAGSLATVATAAVPVATASATKAAKALASALLAAFAAPNTAQTP